jgi:isopenicillin-N N-acyltransferase-like protein
MMSEEPIRLLHVKGSPHERGIEYGRQVGDALELYWQELLRDVRDRVDKPMTEEQLRAWVLERSALAVAAAPDLDDEVRGIAAGAGVDYEIALTITFGQEVNDLTASLGYHAPSSDPGRCLSIIVPPSRSATGGYLLAQTWDGPDWGLPPLVCVVEEEAGSQAFLTDPGWVGGVGVNDRGVASVHTSAEISASPGGMPYPFIARRILQASSLDGAVAAITATPSTAGCHYVVATDEGLVDVEAAGTVSATLRYDGNLISTCANFVDPSCVAAQARPRNPVSLHRVSRLVELASSRATWAPLELFQLLSDHQPGPEGRSVCLHPTPGRSLGSVVLDPSSLRMWAKSGNPCQPAPVREISLADPQFRTVCFELDEALGGD